MKTVVVTGSRGFIGRNLIVRLRQIPNLKIHELSRASEPLDEEACVGEADVIVHLAGVNRPSDPAEFITGNVGYTERLLSLAKKAGNSPHVILASSVHAALENPYGNSKRRAEEVAVRWASESGGDVTVMRLRNVFGKWCRPNYNSVVATFCYNIAHGLPIRVENSGTMLELVHVDDVCDSIIQAINELGPEKWVDEIPVYSITLGDLAERLRTFNERAKTLQVPDMSDTLNRLLYGTFITYLEPTRWEYPLEKKVDQRGDLAEFVKNPAFGQIFVSRTKPGVTRGNHYHHAKVEKFLVIAGSALISFRHIESTEIIEFRVRGEDYRVVEIPPGYSHSITNVGNTEVVTLFWANEIFDPGRPDTTFLLVKPVGTPEQS